MCPAEIINFILEKEGIKAATFAKKIGVNPTQIYDLQSGKIKRISEAVAEKIMNVYPTFSRVWLLTGEGGMAADESSQKSDVHIKSIYLNDNLTMVRYVPIGAAASFVESLWNEEKEMSSIGVLAEEGEELNDEYMVFQVDGDSMEPGIQDKSLILARKIDEGQWENYEGCVVVIVYDNILTVKRIKENRLYGKNFIVLSADNKEHGERVVERCEIRGIWKAERIISQKIK